MKIMTDFERFAEYWEQAVNGLAYRLGSESAPILSRAQVQEIWKEELLTKRFFSEEVKHGAAIFLEELEARRPKTAELVIHRLKTAEMPIGVEGSTIAVKAGLAAAGLVTACTEKLNVVTRLTSLAVGGLFTLKTAQEAAQGTKNALLEAMEKESRNQLLGYQALLEAEE